MKKTQLSSGTNTNCSVKAALCAATLLLCAGLGTQGAAGPGCAGSVDASFDAGTGLVAGHTLSPWNANDFAPRRPLVVQPDGRVLIGGTFSEVQGVPRTSLVRLEADGTVDDSFAPVLMGGEVTVACIAARPQTGKKTRATNRFGGVGFFGSRR